MAIILMGKRELVALLDLSSWCLVTVEWLFLTVPWGFLLFVIVVFPDHTHLLFYMFCNWCAVLMNDFFLGSLACDSTRLATLLSYFISIKTFPNYHI